MKTKNGCIITSTKKLSKRRVLNIRRLVETCCLHDGIRLSYPTEHETGTDCGGLCAPGEDVIPVPRHWFCYSADGQLLSALALVFYPDHFAECSAFTHPDFRHQGLFTQLFECALNSFEEYNILFTVSGRCPDTMTALTALGAELESTEYQMEMELTDVGPASAGADSAGPASASAGVSDAVPSCFLRKARSCHDYKYDGGGYTLWQLTEHVPDGRSADGQPHSRGTVLGSCRTSMVSETCACLHQVEILPPFRGRGYGYAMVSQLLPLLCEEGVRRVILQVSGDNTPAIGLYKKTGFRVTETLSCYLY